MIVGLKVGKPFEAEGFAKVSFKEYGGRKHEPFNFTLADLPIMNPYDWIILLNIISRDPMKYEPIYHILRRMIRGYIQEVSEMDIEISKVLDWKPILIPFPQP